MEIDSKIQMMLPEERKRKIMKEVYCSFCAKSQNEVHKIVAGNLVYICDECIHLCMECITLSKER